MNGHCTTHAAFQGFVALGWLHPDQHADLCVPDCQEDS